MGYCFMSIDKIHTMGELTRKQIHNYRESDVPNADPSKSNLNHEIIEMKDSNYKDAFYRKISESDYYKTHHIRSNNVLAMEVMLTYSSEDNNHMNIEEWEKRNIEWLQETFGKDNVISAVTHEDETCPHVHAIVIPMIDGKLNAKALTGDRGKLIGMQDSYGKKMESLGLKRGARGSHATHEDIKRYYKALNDTLQKELPEPNRLESAKSYRKRITPLYQDINLKNMALERKLQHSKQQEFALSLEEKQDYERLKKSPQKEDKSYQQMQKKAEILDNIQYAISHTSENDRLVLEQMIKQLEEKGRKEKAKQMEKE